MRLISPPVGKVPEPRRENLKCEYLTITSFYHKNHAMKQGFYLEVGEEVPLFILGKSITNRGCSYTLKDTYGKDIRNPTYPLGSAEHNGKEYSIHCVAPGFIGAFEKMAEKRCGYRDARAYRNKETGEMFTYSEMLKEWREKYEGINKETGLYQYHWHTRYDYISPAEEQEAR